MLKTAASGVLDHLLSSCTAVRSGRQIVCGLAGRAILNIPVHKIFAYEMRSSASRERLRTV